MVLQKDNENRWLIGQGQVWSALQAGFRRYTPTQLNMVEVCCDSWAIGQPDRLALTYLQDDGTAEHWTYGGLKQASDRLANAFCARGVGKGDRIAVVLPQVPAVLITYLAAFKLGAIGLPLFSLFGQDALT